MLASVGILTDRRDIISTLQDYNFVHHPRSSRSGGGVGVLLKSSLKVKRNESHTFNSFEYLDLFITSGSSSFRLLCIYRPPPSKKNKLTTTLFFDEFSVLVQDLAIATETVIITGDFNFHIERPDANAMKFLDILDAGGFDQNVRGITHKHGHTLDLIITRQGDLIKTDPPKIVNGCFDISDHLPITCDVYIQKPPPTKKEISHRNLRNIDIEAWHNDLKKALSNPVSPINDVNIACGHFNQTLLHTMDKHAPIRTRLVTLRPYAPWFDDSLRSLKRKKRQLERRYRSTGLEVHRQVFSEHCTLYYDAIKSAKQDYYRKRISNSDQSQLFNLIDDLLTVKSAPPLPSHDSPQVLANSFADFFDNKIVSLKERLRSSNFVDNDLSIVINQPSCSSCFNNFSEVTVDQITKLIAKSKPKTSKLDPAPTGLIKQSVNIVAPFVTNIINASLTSGIFPTDLKKGLILPLLKKPSLDREELCNYRPITNLTFLSKLTGRVVASQMLAYLQSNSLLSKFQSAYRPLHSTETAILRVVNDVQSAIDRREEVVLVLLDLSSAFDTIDHEALLTRLHTRYGISGTAIAWFRSYLVDRYQQVVIHGHSSRPVSLQFGVPQGSVLGPLLFALFFAPIEDIILAHGLKVMVYADDTQLYISISSLDDRPSALSLLETCTRDILIWCTINGLACNPDKTEIIHLSSRFSKTPPIHAFNVNGYRISPSHSVRSLGVTLDRHLQMSQHVNMLCKSAFFSLKNISKIRKFLDWDNTERLVHAFISSKIDYCNSILIGLPNEEIDKIQRVQNAAARLISGTKKYASITPILIKLHWLPVIARIEYKILLTVFKSLNNLAPEYISELLNQYNPPRALRSANKNLLIVPKTLNKTYGDRAFYAAAPKLWNNLPQAIRDCNSITSFKSNLKTHLFRKHYKL